ncbi:MAG: ribonuclease III [Clostridiales bacterium]|nr:ribonuclease III [Clostridiales bacterium]
MTNFPYTELEKKLGYVFQNKALLKEAFTHSTYANKYGGEDNERMEYLGDAVLQLVVTEWQYVTHARSDEGDLTKCRQKLVCEEALDKAVRALGLQQYLLTVGGAANVGRKTVSSIFETVVAAIYLDGGYTAAKEFIYRHGMLHDVTEEKNPKGALQEYLQKFGKEPPVYVCKQSGKDNAPIFRCEARAAGFCEIGEGGSKKEAESAAASAMLEKLLCEKPWDNQRK